MNEKNSIILVNKDGKYSFQKVTEIIGEDNVVEVANSDYNALLRGEAVNIRSENIDLDKDIQLVFNQQAIYDKAIQSGLSEKEALAKTHELIQSIGENIESIEIETINNMVSLKIQAFKKLVEESNAETIHISDIDPNDVISKVKEKVIAQDNAVNTIVRNIYNNQLVIESGDEGLIDSQKTSVLLDGPTGTGKTLIMKEVAKQMNLPIVITPATMYATTGYRGVELQKMLISLLEAADGNIENAQRGIIVLDEFDKLGNTDDSDSSLEIRKAVQQDLLTYIGGSKYNIEYKGKNYEFDTSKVTFICLGAFTNMREKKQENLDENGNYRITEEDYINAGIMRELVGRFQLITSTRSLSKEDFIRILRESSISPLNKLVELSKNIYNANVVFDDDIIDQIATLALKKDTGARALNSVVNSLKNLILDQLDESRRTPELTEIRITTDMLHKVENQSLRNGNESKKSATKDMVTELEPTEEYEFVGVKAA